MRIESRRVGTIEVDQSSIIEIPRGLLGLSGRTEFVMLEFGEGVPLGWLQCVTDSQFGLPIADPGLFTARYEVELSRSEVEDLEFDDENDAVFLIITTIGEGGVKITGNLRAPILVNVKNRRGRQLVLDRSDLDLRAEVDPLLFARALGMAQSESEGAVASLQEQTV